MSDLNELETHWLRLTQAAQDAARKASTPRKSSGVSTHGVPVPRSEPTEEEMYRMPMEELRKRANKQLAEWE